MSVDAIVNAAKMSLLGGVASCIKEQDIQAICQILLPRYKNVQLMQSGWFSPYSGEAGHALIHVRTRCAAYFHPGCYSGK